MLSSDPNKYQLIIFFIHLIIERGKYMVGVWESCDLSLPNTVSQTLLTSYIPTPPYPYSPPPPPPFTLTHQVTEPVEHLPRVVLHRRLVVLERTPPIAQEVREAAPVDPLHEDLEHALLLNCGAVLDDVLMLQLRVKLNLLHQLLSVTATGQGQGDGIKYMTIQ